MQICCTEYHQLSQMEVEDHRTCDDIHYNSKTSSVIVLLQQFCRLYFAQCLFFFSHSFASADSLANAPDSPLLVIRKPVAAKHSDSYSYLMRPPVVRQRSCTTKRHTMLIR